MSMTTRLSIDFGTCLSCAALRVGDDLKIVKNPTKLGFSFPSSVYVTEEGDFLIGDNADYRRLKDPNRYFNGFKRYLGRDEPFPVGEREIFAQDLVAAVLQQLKAEAEKMLDGQPPSTAAVLTVPAEYQQHKRRLMEAAGRKAGFTEITLLEEPVAAAVYYAERASGGRGLQEGENLLVYDLGGGTFDAALLQKQGNGFRLLVPPVGDPRCGGMDFDRCIYEDLQRRSSPTLQETLDPQRRDAEALRARSVVAEACQALKIQLTYAEDAEPVLPMFTEEDYRLTRSAFNAMILPYLEKTCGLCRRLIQEAGIGWEQVCGVLLVGGSCRVPYVQEVVAREFGRPVFRVEDPELAVCLGAALHGAERDRPASAGLAPNVTKTVRPSPEKKAAAKREHIPPQQEAPEESGMRSVELLRTLTGHKDVVSCLAISPDGKTLTSGSWDADIKLWNLLTGKEKAIFVGHEAPVTCLAIGPDGTTWVSADIDRNLLLWNLRPGARNVTLNQDVSEELTFAVYGTAECLAISPDGKTLAVGKDNGGVRLADMRTGEEKGRLVGSDAVLCLAFSPDGKTLAVGHTDAVLELWNWKTAETKAYISEDHEDEILGVVFSLDGKSLVSSSRDRTIRVWKLPRKLDYNAEEIDRFEAGNSVVCALALSPDGRVLVGGDEYGTLTLWDFETRQPLQSLKTHKGQGGIHALAFSPDGKMLVTAGADKTLKVWGPGKASSPGAEKQRTK